MTTLLRSLIARTPARSADLPVTLDEWAATVMSFGGLEYLVSRGTLSGDREQIESNFAGYVQGAFKRNSVIFACMLVRQLLFSEARFQFQRMNSGRPGDLFGTRDLAVLEVPWANGTTGALLSRMIQDADLAGNFYGVLRPGPSLRRLAPDCVTIVLGSATGLDVDREVAGYIYQPPGSTGPADAQAFLPEHVAHFAPVPDPVARFRGMSWLTPVLREIQADSAATTHKLKFFENGATPNVVVTLGDVGSRMTPQVFQQWVDKFEAQKGGLANAYKTWYLAAGSDAKVIGSDLKQVDFKITQGAGETRIAAAAGVPPVIIGLSEGLQAATYSNYAQACRRLGDMTMRPLWREAAASLAPVVNVPGGARLWYDDRDIPALQEDRKDAAAIQQVKAETIAALVKEGFTAESVVAAVEAEDMTLLIHTGMVSVQLQPPGQGGSSQNGNGQPVLPASTS